MPNNWTRAHDAWIARECEGMEVIEQDGLYVIFAGWCSKYQQEPEKLFKNVYCYNTDPAAAIRAAEAWRKKDEGTDRTVNLHSAVERVGIPYRVDLHENYRTGEFFAWRTFDGESDVDYWHALAQALYRATGGPS
jgi:hypothetical protein